jgi:hypothetical protein
MEELSNLIKTSGSQFDMHKVDKDCDGKQKLSKV